MRPIHIDFAKERIVMTRAFAKKASDPTTAEYRKLKGIISTVPSFRVECHTNKKNARKESYKGLNYEFMKSYIETHADKSKKAQLRKALEEQIFLSECHSIKYPVVKKWFLATFPEIKENYGKVITDFDEVNEVKTLGFIFSDIKDNVEDLSA